MATKKSTTKRTAARTTTKRAAAKKPTTRATAARTKRTVAKKPAARKAAARRVRNDTIDYYPNRVALLTATAAVLILLALGMITAL